LRSTCWAKAQLDLSRRFAAPGDDKFAQGAWATGEGGVPLLSDPVTIMSRTRRLPCPMG
jgi:hypothetical protein